ARPADNRDRKTTRRQSGYGECPVMAGAPARRDRAMPKKCCSGNGALAAADDGDEARPDRGNCSCSCPSHSCNPRYHVERAAHAILVKSVVPVRTAEPASLLAVDL